VLPRYRKLSREISQARWTVTEENEDYDEELSAANVVDNNTKSGGGSAVSMFENANESNTTNSKLKSVRKGKMSVEEIVCEAVNHAMKAKLSRLHPWCVTADTHTHTTHMDFSTHILIFV
jgi:tRNA U54 and U55 pseudouridine synthase Pus10